MTKRERQIRHIKEHEEEFGKLHCFSVEQYFDQHFEEY